MRTNLGLQFKQTVSSRERPKGKRKVSIGQVLQSNAKYPTAVTHFKRTIINPYSSPPPTPDDIISDTPHKNNYNMILKP